MIHQDSVTVPSALSFLCSAIVPSKRRPRFRSDSTSQLAQRMASDRGLYGSTSRRSNSASIASKTISAGITARLVQRMIAARGDLVIGHAEATPEQKVGKSPLVHA